MRSRLSRVPRKFPTTIRGGAMNVSDPFTHHADLLRRLQPQLARAKSASYYTPAQKAANQKYAAKCKARKEKG